MNESNSNVPGSFRDPSGFLYFQDGSLYRQVNRSYAADYDHLMSSGLYEALVNSRLIVPHEETRPDLARTDKAYRVLKHELLPFISYPYEWCFSQLKDAALATLMLQKRALEFGMTLKDASAYNIQFHRGRPVHIDTLSFERYSEGQTWTPYRQFCQHFLAPLALMSLKDHRLSQLSRIHIDGIPLDLASSLLPFRTRLNPSLFSHLHLHAAAQGHFSDKTVKRARGMGRLAFMGLIDSLESAVKGLEPPRPKKGWSGYYSDTNYSTASIEHKKSMVRAFLEELSPSSVWDLGANTGEFSRIPAAMGVRTVSFDLDHSCVEENYRDCAARGETSVLPLVLDLANPSGGIGWENTERASIIQRGPADVALALALVHHLAISNNVPFEDIARFLARVCETLIIEFVPKEDSQVKRLLAGRKDIFENYDRPHFEEEFKRYFFITNVTDVKDTVRTLYMMKRVSR